MILWLIAFLIGLDVGLRFTGGFGAPILNDSPRVAVMKEYLAGSSRPNVIVLGSSLAFAANYYCDTKYATRALPKNTADNGAYLNAIYFEDALNKARTKKFQVANLSIPGGMAQDAYVIAKRLIQSGKRPALVIYEVAPRDLVDNLMPIGCGALAGALEPDGFSQNYHELNIPPGLRRFLDVLDNSPLVLEWRRGLNKLGKQPTTAAVRDFYIACVWQFYNCKSELKKNLLAFACTSLGRQPTLYAAAVLSQKENKAKQTANNPICHDKAVDLEISNYSARYNPPNYKQFIEQSLALKKLAKLCEEEKVSLLLINMPITFSNKALIDAKLYEAYRQKLVSLTKQHDCKLIDMDKSDIFHQEDFKDSVHLNIEGGRKFQDTLVQKLISAGIL